MQPTTSFVCLILNDLTSVYHMQATSTLLSLQFCCPSDSVVTLFIDFIAMEWGGQGRDFVSNMTKIQKKDYVNRISTWFAILDVQHFLSIASEVPRIARAGIYKAEIGPRTQGLRLSRDSQSHYTKNERSAATASPLCSLNALSATLRSTCKSAASGIHSV